jgi:hypothetical protein
MFWLAKASPEKDHPFRRIPRSLAYWMEKSLKPRILRVNHHVYAWRSGLDFAVTMGSLLP